MLDYSRAHGIIKVNLAPLYNIVVRHSDFKTQEIHV
jgi:hypothetical protein